MIKELILVTFAEKDFIKILLEYVRNVTHHVRIAKIFQVNVHNVEWGCIYMEKIV
jgi:hypothetical protein